MTVVWHWEVNTPTSTLAIGNAPDKGSAGQGAMMAISNDPFALPRIYNPGEPPTPPDPYEYTIKITPMKESTPPIAA